MATIKLSAEDIAMILESLGYTKKHFEGYQYYPSEEFKRSQIKRVEELIERIKNEAKK